MFVEDASWDVFCLLVLGFTMTVQVAQERCVGTTWAELAVDKILICDEFDESERSIT